MREREREHIKARALEIEREQMNAIYPLAVDETPEVRLIERSDELEAFFTCWLFDHIWLGSPLSVKKVVYGAAGDCRRTLGKGSAITFKRYLNQRIFESRPIYRLVETSSGLQLVDAIRRKEASE